MPISIQTYLESIDLRLIQLHSINRKTLQQPTRINPIILPTLPFIYPSTLHQPLHMLHNALQHLPIRPSTIINHPLPLIPLPEHLHILPSLQQLLLIISKRFQKDRIFHLVVHLMQVGETFEAH